MKRFLQGRNAIYAAVAGGALAIALVLILVSVIGSSGKKKAAPPTIITHAATTTTTPRVPHAPDTGGMTTAPATTKPKPAPPLPTVPGGAATAALLAGIPQQLNALGNPSAPFTLVEFADPQCPFCRIFTLDVLPTVIQRYVRPGKLKIIYFGIDILGPDSRTALTAIYAAGLQSKLWDYVDLLYKNQGEENSGWVTDGILQAVANSIHGIKTAKLMAARPTTGVKNAIDIAIQQASSASVNATPTFFAGPSGKTLQHLNVTALTAGEFTSLLDPIVK